MMSIITSPPGYESFADLFLDVPIKFYIVSAFFSLVPLLLIVLFSKPIVYRPFCRIIGAIHIIMDWVQDWKMRKNVRITFDIFSEKKQSSIPTFIMFITMSIVVAAILTHTFYFALIISNSMQPHYGKGDIIFIESLTLDSLSVGEIVVAKPPGVNYKLVHRIHEIRTNGVIKTKGDNTPLPDWWELKPENIEGKVVTYNGAPIVVRGLGVYFMPIKTPYLEKDPAFMGIRNLIGFTQVYGQIIIMLLVLIMIIATIKEENA